MHGYRKDVLILLDKPAGITSFRAVSVVRRYLKCDKAGHTGTLDPMASGLLVVLVGEATKIAPFLIEEPKIYEARMQLGVETDTYDIEGKALRQAEVEVSEEEIRKALERLKGPRTQAPPPFSAAKFKGKPLYHYARRGKPVEGRPRAVEIYDIRTERVSRVEGRTMVDCVIACSKGTYIRSLCKEVGDLLGCGAALAGLRRIAAGPFRVTEALGLEECRHALSMEESSGIMSINQALAHLPSIEVRGREVSMVRSGQPLRRLRGPAGQPVLLTDERGTPLALQATPNTGEGEARVLRVFNISGESVSRGSL